MERIINKTDVAFKFGCGRYIQKTGLLAEAGGEVARFGRRAWIVAGPTAWSVAGAALQQGLARAQIECCVNVYGGHCSHEQAYAFAHSDAFAACDVIVGVGGGAMMDFAKLVAQYSYRPVVLVPTSSATCASYTPLSVCYDDDGKTVGTTKFPWEVSALLCDMDVLSTQPARLLTAGSYDAMAKMIELRHCGGAEDDVNVAPGMRLASVMAEYFYGRLHAITPQAVRDVGAGRNSPYVEEVVYFSIVGAGLCSGLANGSNQTAIAHKFYELTRSFLTKECAHVLHGELVAMGLIAQTAYNSNADDARAFAQEMRAIGLPCSLSELGVAPTAELLERYCTAINASRVMKGRTAAEQERLKESLKLIFV